MKNILLLVCLCLTTTMTNAQEAFVKEYQQKLSNLKSYLLDLAEAMPEEHYDFKPTEEQRSFKDQLMHITGNMVWLTSSYLGGEKVEGDLRSSDYTKKEVIAFLSQALVNAEAAVTKLPLAELETQVKFFAGPMSKRQIMILLNDHAVHHRGQIIVYARMKGVTPPKYSGW